MIILLTAIFFVFGLIIGSFLNVVILRFNTSKTFGGRSACMVCQKQLVWYELIPVFSFLGLRGRCRTCKTKISIQYPVVELVTGVVFAALFFKFNDLFFLSTISFVTTYVYYTLMSSLLIVIAAYDARHKIIPDPLSLIFGIFAFIGLFLFNSSGLYPHIPSLLEFFSGIIIAAPFAFLWLVSKGTWMGLGDAKLLIGLGWFIGLPLAVSGLAIGFWLGAVVGLSLVIFSDKHGMKTQLPLAPFLVLGMLLAFLLEVRLF